MNESEAVKKVHVIIVGGIHHNGLNLARMLGEHGVFCDALLIGNNRHNYVGRSRFVRFSRCFDTEKEAFDYILQNYDPREEKYLIFPFSDGAAMELDMRLDSFSEFIVPSISGVQGKIAALMDKKAQYDFALKHEIKMPVSLMFRLSHDSADTVDFYPNIVKPVVSATGDKGDIRVCYTRTELDEALKLFKEQNYSECLVQQFIEKDYEILIVGAVYKNAPGFDFTAHKVVRQWPLKTGSGSYDEMITDPDILDRCSRILQKIKDIGYCGLIDIELLMSDGEIYLNEFNWRNSGGGYRAMSAGFHYPYWFYLDASGSTFENDYRKDAYVTSMLELWDFNNVMANKISLSDWLKQYGNTDNFAYRYKGDMRPVNGILAKWVLKCCVKTVLKTFNLIHY